MVVRSGASRVSAAVSALNPRRIERYLMTAENSRIPALVLVNKADVVALDEAEAALFELAEGLPTARVLLVSAHTGQGLLQLSAELLPASSAVFLGSSGVGKSTLVNALLGHEAVRTSPERSDDARGRHTTTERQLLKLRSGALLIDTPGMRELALWADTDTDTELAGGAFDDIEELARACHFRDCNHEGEPGCAVLVAIESGALTATRLAHARKLQREMLHQQGRVDVRLRLAKQREHKIRTRATRSHIKQKGGG